MAEKEDVKKLIERYTNPPNKLRSVQEINARYRQTLENYREICLRSDNDVREHKAATHAEIKMLGWVLGKPDKDVIKDIAEHSNLPMFPPQSSK